MREFVHVFRQLRKQPGFVCLVVLTLGVAIGASTLVFTVVEAVLLRPLPYRDPGRLVVVKEEVNLLGKGQPVDLPAPDVRRFEKQMRSFEHSGGFVRAERELSGRGEPVQLAVTRTGASVFPTLGVRPIVGRIFTQKEDDDGQLVAMLSYQLWKSRFGGNPQVVGQPVQLDCNTYMVIGVMPRGFEFPLTAGRLNETQLWVPMSFTPYERADFGDNWQYGLVARLKDGVTLRQSEAEANQVARDIQAEYPEKSGVTVRASVIGLKEEVVKQARPLVSILFYAVMVVLLVGCANVAGLLLVRAIRRQREVGVLIALGAPPSSVVRQPLMESLLLSGMGATTGLLLASIALELWVKLLPDTLPRLQEIGINWTVAGFAAALAISTGLLCGLTPAFAALRTAANDALQHSRRVGQGVRHGRLRSALVAGEVAVAMVLLTSAGLLAKSFEKMRSVNPGFQPEHVVTGSYTLPEVRYPKQQIDQFHLELLARLQQLPGVRKAGLSTALPMADPTSDRFFEAEDFLRETGQSLPHEANAYVVGDFLRAMQIPLLRGRYLDEHDTANAPLVIVVNRALATQYWPGQNPIGKRMRWSPGSHYKRPWMTVVGEVADTKQGALDSKDMPQAYEPLAQERAEFGELADKIGPHARTMEFAVRTADDPRSIERAIRQVVWSMDRQLPVNHLQTMEQAISKTEAPRRFNTSVISLFALLAVGLAALGIYAVMVFSVAQRTHEIGIRVALGAQPSQVMRLIVGSGVRLGLIGCAFGVLGAVWASRLLKQLLFDVSPFDASVYCLAVAGVLALALAASLLPARRAAAVNPVEALRVE